MSKLFDSRKDYMTGKFLEQKAFVLNSSAVKNMEVNDTVVADYNSNSEQFKLLCTNLARQLFVGKVSSNSYAAVVGAIAERIGVPYVVGFGYCLPNDYPKMEEELRIFSERKQTDEHPIVPTMIYIKNVENGAIYEYYNGRFDSKHIDCVEVAGEELV